MLVRATPEHYFVPPYVGQRGWIGIRLDRKVAWNDIKAAVEDAYLAVAPKRLIESSGRASAAFLDGGSRGRRRVPTG